MFGRVAEDYKKDRPHSLPPKCHSHEHSSKYPTGTLWQAGFFKEKPGLGAEDCKKRSQQELAITKKE